MNLRRIFANAIARRIAYVVVAIALACFGFDAKGSDHVARADAFAHCASEMLRVNTGPVGSPPSQGWAEAPKCRHEARGAPWLGAYILSCRNMNFDGSVRAEEGSCVFGSSQNPTPSLSPTHRYSSDVCPSGTEWNESEGMCLAPCADRSPISAAAPGDTTTVCQYGCAFECQGLGLLTTIDGAQYTVCAGLWNPSGSSCPVNTPPPVSVPADGDGDGSSDDNDLSPNNPGESGDGGGQDNSTACGGPSQPACAPDGSNEGSGKGNTSGGGGNCQTPPRSSGDAILAQIAFQAWATRCAIEGNANQGGGTGGTPGGGGDGIAQEIMDYLDGNGQQLEDPEDPWIEGDGPEPSDWSLGLGSGSCPAPISETVSLGGHSATIAFSFQPLCDLAGLLNTVFRALGLLIGAYIIAGVRR